MVGQSHRSWTPRLILSGIIVFVSVGICSWRWAGSKPKQEEPDRSELVADTVERGQHPLDQVLELAKESLAHLEENVRDYRAKVSKRERINGTLGDEVVVFIKIMESVPNETESKLHAYVRFESPSSVKGREVIWIERENQGRLIAHEAGMLNLVRTNLDPNGMVAMLGNRYPISDIGLRNLLRKLIEKGESDRALGSCDVVVHGAEKVGDRDCRMIEVIHPVKKPGYDFHVVKIYFDEARKIPLRYASYSWPDKQGDPPKLEEEYTYFDLETNVGLALEDFDPNNRAYKFP